MSELFYSQNGEDKWIVENLSLPRRGFYIDIGAGHPFVTSNTAFLRARGWTGLAIDGNRIWADEWRDIETFCCAIISNEPEVLFMEDSANWYWSRIGELNGSQRRKAETIEQCLSRYHIGKIDFLSIDTEGSEIELLYSFDFDVHAPAIVIVEYNAAHLPVVAPDQSPIPVLMESRGYSLRRTFEPVNMIFTKC